MNNLISRFSQLADPRIGNAKLYNFSAIIIIAILAKIAGADTFVEIAEFAKSKSGWLETHLELPNGVPSHDTFNRVFRLLDPQEFESIFSLWTQDVQKITDNEFIAVDGKTVCGSKDGEQGPLHIVSAWASKSNMVISQQKTDQKSNEITAMHSLLDRLVIEGCIVTIDAMGCQKEITKKIVGKGGDYVLALKGNQPNLHDDVKTFFEKEKPLENKKKLVRNT